MKFFALTVSIGQNSKMVIIFGVPWNFNQTRTRLKYYGHRFKENFLILHVLFGSEIFQEAISMHSKRVAKIED